METHRRLGEDRGWKVYMHVKDTQDSSNQRPGMEDAWPAAMWEITPLLC